MGEGCLAMKKSKSYLIAGLIGLSLISGCSFAAGKIRRTSYGDIEKAGLFINDDREVNASYKTLNK